MARCGCTTGLCACSVVGADSDTVTTDVVGTGTVDVPYIVTSEVILVPDGEGPLLGENALKADALGLYVEPAEAEGCVCAWAYVSSTNQDAVLTASAGPVSVDIVWDSILQSEGAWSIVGGEIVPPDDTALYQAMVLADMSAGTGSDAVLMGLTVTGVTGWEIQTYQPSGLPSALQSTSLVDMTFFDVDVSIRAAAAATRSVGTYVEAMILQVCGCTSPFAESA